MTQEEIIEMARQAGWSGIYSSWTSPTNRTSLTVPVTMQQLEAFTNLVAAKEREALAQEQEPVAIVDANDDGYWADILPNRSVKVGQLLYTTPPQRTWVGLTDEEIAQGWKESWVTEQAWQSAVWWAEEKLKEKNT